MKPGSLNSNEESLNRRRLNRILYRVGVACGILLTLLIAVIFLLRWVNPPFTSFTLQQDWRELGVERYSLRTNWIDERDIPDHLRHAAVASEDQLFYQHIGFDWSSIQEAYQQRVEGDRERGASTISQQVAKNLFLWPAASFVRKGIEVGITLFIELFWGKDRIMNVYLNIAEFGPGVFGVGSASLQFFNLPASELSPEQSARLIAVLPSPKRMRVEPPSPYTRERSLWILNQMTMMTGIGYVPRRVTGGQDMLRPDSLSGQQSGTVTRDSIGVQIEMDPDSVMNSFQPDTAAEDGAFPGSDTGAIEWPSNEVDSTVFFPEQMLKQQQE